MGFFFAQIMSMDDTVRSATATARKGATQPKCTLTQLIRPATVVLDRICVDGLEPATYVLELGLEQSATLAFTVLRPEDGATPTERRGAAGVVEEQLNAKRLPGTTQSLCSIDLCDIASTRSGNSKGGTGSVRSYNPSLLSGGGLSRRSGGRPMSAKGDSKERPKSGARARCVYAGDWAGMASRLTVGENSHLVVKLREGAMQKLFVDDLLPISSLTRFQKCKFIVHGEKAKLSLSLELQPAMHPRSIIFKGFSLPELAKERRVIGSAQYYLECTLGPQCTRVDFTSTDLAHTHIDPQTAECTLNHKTGPERNILLEAGCTEMGFKLVRRHILRADCLKGVGTLPLSSLSPERATVLSVKLDTLTLLVLLRVGYPIE